jgi:CYTH domain-containing protein
MMQTDLEIERKFIIDRVPNDVKNLESSIIRQGYICSNDKREVRCRQIDKKFFLTIKSTGNLIREETEVELNEDQFNSIWNVTESARVYKERYKLNYGRNIIELDIFKDNLSGLIIAEVEFETAEDSKKFIKPDWFGKEVTNDKRYKNKNLAVNALPKN